MIERGDGVYIDIEVTPGSGSQGVRGYDEWRKRVRVAVRAEARDGKANSAIIILFCELFQVSHGRVTITSGHTSGQKRIFIKGIDQNTVIKTLEGAIVPG